MTPKKAASPLPLNERKADLIRQKIFDGEFLPGQRLSEAALSESLEISRNTLREVFRILTQEGVLSHAPHRGVSVAIPTAAAIMDIYRVRRLIECQALAQAYPQHPARQQMRAAVEAALRQREAGDWRGVGTANMAFHRAIVRLADSSRLDTLFEQMLAELRLAFGLLKDSALMHGPYVDTNRQILALFEAGQQVESAALLKEYLHHSERVVLAQAV